MPGFWAKHFGDPLAVKASEDLLEGSKKIGELLETPEKLSEKKIEQFREAAVELDLGLKDLLDQGGGYLTSKEIQDVRSLLDRVQKFLDQLPPAAKPESAKAPEKLPPFRSESASLESEGHPEHNEDRAFADDEHAFYGVLDGVAGSLDGEAAARLGKEIMVNHAADFEGLDVAQTKRQLADIFNECRQALLEQSPKIYRQTFLKSVRQHTEKPRHTLIDTTATIVKLVADEAGKERAVVAHAGDSRLYRFNRKSGELKQLTFDHTPVLLDTAEKYGREAALKFQDLLNRLESYDQWQAIRSIKERARRGEKLYAPEEQGALRFTDEEIAFIDGHGLEAEIVEYLKGTQRPREVVAKTLIDQPEITDFELAEGDELLLTSDGIHDNLTADEIQQILAGDLDLLEDPAVQSAALKAGEIQAERLAAAAQARSRDRNSERAKPDDMTAVQIVLGQPRAAKQQAA